MREPKVLLDIHGVVCDLLSPMGANPVNWNFRHNRLTLVGFYDQNLDLLATAPETEYCEPLRNWLQQIPIFISSCKKSWEPHVEKWLNKHFQTHIHCFVRNPENKLSHLKEGDWLIEDYPGFTDYSQIILVDRPYNRGVKCDKRVTTPDELLRALDEVLF